MVRWYWNALGKTTKKTIIGRQNGYHGSTAVSASMGGMTFMHTMADLPLPGFVHIMQPYWYGLGGDLTPDEFGRKAAQALEDKIIELGPENVGAFIGEPIQGAGGVIIPPATYWPEIQKICRKHDVLLIADEVICGFGRTGRWWGSERFGITPDLMTVAKGLSSGYLPIAALLLGARLGDAVAAAGQEWAHGFTWSGHPVAAAVALENLRLIEAEGLHERAGGPLGAYFARALASLGAHPLVGEVRSCGLIAALELVADKAARRAYPPERRVGLACRDRSVEHGLVMRAVRDVMVLAPPLIISEDEIDELVLRARAALDQTVADLGLG
jgi:putrescine aminotransferase